MKLLTVDEVAARTRAPRKTVFYWIYRGYLPSLKVGRRRLVPLDGLRHFLAARAVST